ncbi:uncharacterized protein BX663DRAFT_548116 [Cokeromyces recurvatus]|uniref:uncharacterized protein n=1 Tax=Cokeromyces recurvatus TaxID=90255 RepID=UPI00221E4978|nr:uncharacterized protein BX663DRAFT_548116 [Cokeromyces recurvatus]KAI7907024.1 hypothetical protein BX663DRAFT_548116 [Cokeromyces recurvatus]
MACHLDHLKAKDAKEEVQLELEDFCDEEVQKYFQPCAVDPGRDHIFTATVRHEED